MAAEHRNSPHKASALVRLQTGLIVLLGPSYRERKAHTQAFGNRFDETCGQLTFRAIFAPVDSKTAVPGMVAESVRVLANEKRFKRAHLRGENVDPFSVASSRIIQSHL